MRPLFYPMLVNGRSGDPAVYVEVQFEKQALLFDLGDIRVLPPSKIRQLDHVLVSHTHIDHFFGFDYLLRILVGRQKTLNLVGPSGFIEQVDHKLQAYRWNLIDRYVCDLAFEVTEVDLSLTTRKAQFRLKNGFAMEDYPPGSLRKGVLFEEANFSIATTVLDHRTPCLAFALDETLHANVWKTRLTERGLPVGPWLRELKRAIIENYPDDHRVPINSAKEKSFKTELPLGALRNLVTVTPGQKIAYVTDAADTETNRAKIVELARNADILFIEAAFSAADKARATERDHLTTTAAGEIARAAGARRIEPFHFSRRYRGDEEQLIREVQAAFADQRPEDAI